MHPYPLGSVLRGRFRIERLIGKGGNSYVYLSMDALLERAVATKVTKRPTAASEARLKTEAQYMARFDHPSICPVYDCGALEDGRGFLVTPWIPGKSVAHLVAHDPFDIGAALTIARAIASALVAVHDQNLVHRDVKPGNIMIRLHDGAPDFGTPVLIDFGSVRPLTEVVDTEQRTTAPGDVLGTLDFMAPEQLLGRRETVATDLYALGATLFSMIYRRSPFEHVGSDAAFAVMPAIGRSSILTGPYVVRKITSEITLPDTPTLGDAERGLLISLLRLDPRERPASARAVAQALDEVIGAPSSLQQLTNGSEPELAIPARG